MGNAPLNINNRLLYDINLSVLNNRENGNDVFNINVMNAFEM